MKEEVKLLSQLVCKKTYFALFSMVVVLFFLQSQTQKVRYFTRVGCVDLQKVIESVSQNAKLSKILSLDAASISKIQQLQTRIAEQNAIIQNSPPDGKDARNAHTKLSELQEELNSAQGNYSSSSGSYYRSYLSDAAYINIFKEIKKLALEQGFSMILEKDASVLYIEADLDLTDPIIKKIQNLVR